MVITSGSISEEASELAEQYFVDEGIRIELFDGFQFAKLIVEHGIATSWWESAPFLLKQHHFSVVLICYEAARAKVQA